MRFNNRWADFDGEPTFFCPGCKMLHCVWVHKPNSKNAIWSLTGDLECPTFAPSLLVQTTFKGEPVKCHSFIRAGKIEFLSDCTHEFAGQTIPVPELPDWVRE